jgi:hypothetical protein
MNATSNDSTVRDKSNATFSDFRLLILSLASLLLVVVEVVKVEEVMVEEVMVDPRLLLSVRWWWLEQEQGGAGARREATCNRHFDPAFDDTARVLMLKESWASRARQSPATPAAYSIEAVTRLARVTPASEIVGTRIHRLSAMVPCAL